jgi:hypothetical protein
VCLKTCAKKNICSSEGGSKRGLELNRIRSFVIGALHEIFHGDHIKITWVWHVAKMAR